MTPTRTPQRLRIEPRLTPLEVEEVAGFHPHGSDVRRIRAGQPSARSPWAPSSDGRHLVLDEDVDAGAAVTVSGWLRFLTQEPLRGRHRVVGEVVVNDVRVVGMRGHLVTERILPRT